MTSLLPVHGSMTRPFLPHNCGQLSSLTITTPPIFKTQLLLLTFLLYERRCCKTNKYSCSNLPVNYLNRF